MSLMSEVETLLSGVSNIYIGSMPVLPDNVVALYNSGGYARELSGTKLEQPTFQVRVRNISYDSGQTACNTVKDLLHGKSTSAILMIEQQGDIQDLGRDELNRSEFSLNFRCIYRR